ncbi:UNVERIFIED_CONTAM: St14 [Trichonephila clavipes]
MSQKNILHARCRRRKVPETCYHKGNQFSIKLLGKKKLERKIRIKRIIPHSKFYFSKIVYDIALLELEEPLKCTGKTSPICLPTKKMYKTGQKIFVAGWGRTKTEPGSGKYFN